MRQKLTSIVTAIAMVAVLFPAPRAQAINSEIYYTVWMNCYCGCIEGEWTKPCGEPLYGWGVPPNGGDPPNCYYTQVTYGPSCD